LETFSGLKQGKINKDQENPANLSNTENFVATISSWNLKFFVRQAGLLGGHIALKSPDFFLVHLIHTKSGNSFFSTDTVTLDILLLVIVVNLLTLTSSVIFDAIHLVDDNLNKHVLQ
jgi:hypothetical protein